MSVFISNGFLVKIVQKGGCQIDPMLIGYRCHHPNHIGKFIGERIGRFAGFKRLIAIDPGYKPGHFTHLLGQHSHIGQRREIAHTDSADPMVNGVLHLLHCQSPGPRIFRYAYVCTVHHSLSRESIIMVTGPSLTSATFISAPNTPLSTRPGINC